MDIFTSLADSGLVGVTIALIVYMVYRDKMYNKTLNNHLNHFTEALHEDSRAKVLLARNQEKQSMCLDKLSKAIQSCPIKHENSN